jgi:hypothetical protein
MSLRTWLLGKDADASFQVEVPPEMQQGWSYSGQVAPRISRTEALQVPAVLRSRNLIAGTLAHLPIHIRDKERKIVSPTTLLDQIDPDIPNVVTFAQTYEDLLFEGLSWWRVTETGWHGYPTFAQHISPDRVHVSGVDLPLSNGNAAYGSKQIYVDGRPVFDDEIIRFDSPNPPLLRHAARAIRTCLRLDTTAATYADEPLPLGYFTPRDGAPIQRNEAEIQDMLDKWEALRRHKAWGYVGAQWEARVIQFNAEQIQLADQRQHAVLEIARAAGIDPEDLGVSTTSRTYQNSEQRRLDLLDFTLAAYVAAVEQRLSMRDVLPRGYEAKVNFDGFLRADTKTRMEAYQIGKAVGAYTHDEIRELEDRPATPEPKPPPAPPVPMPAPAPQKEAQP